MSSAASRRTISSRCWFVVGGEALVADAVAPPRLLVAGGDRRLVGAARLVEGVPVQSARAAGLLVREAAARGSANGATDRAAPPAPSSLSLLHGVKAYPPSPNHLIHLLRHSSHPGALCSMVTLKSPRAVGTGPPGSASSSSSSRPELQAQGDQVAVEGEQRGRVSLLICHVALGRVDGGQPRLTVGEDSACPGQRSTGTGGGSSRARRGSKSCSRQAGRRSVRSLRPDR